MDHTAYSGHQRQQVSSSEVLSGDQGGSQNPDQSCYCDLAETREGPMSKQGAQDQKASSSWSFIYFTLIFHSELKINLDVHSS